MGFREFFRNLFGTAPLAPVEQPAPPQPPSRGPVTPGKPTTTGLKYGPRTLKAIEAQCEARGIPHDELAEVFDFIERKYGRALLQMNVSELRRVNVALGATLEEYLGGRKRKGESPRDAW